MARSLVATEIGVKRAKEALIDLGITQTVLAEKRLKYSRSTVSNFFNRKPIAHENFTEICKILKLEWRDIAEIAEGEATQDDAESSAPAASSKSARQEFQQIDDKVKQVEKQIRLAFAIAGTVDQVDQAKLTAILNLLRQITNDASVSIIDVQEGSIKLILTGTPEALKMVHSLYRSGELTEVEGIPIEYVNLLVDESEIARNQNIDDLSSDLSKQFGSHPRMKVVEFNAGEKFFLMLVPNGSVEEAWSALDQGNIQDVQPIFSLVTANPTETIQTGQIIDITGDGNTFIMEDMRVDKSFDHDYNDLIFQVKGATINTATLDDLISTEEMQPKRDWRSTELGQLIIADSVPAIPKKRSSRKPFFLRSASAQKSPSVIPIDFESNEDMNISAETDPPEDVVESSIIEVVEIPEEEADWDPLATEESEVEEVLEDLTTDGGSLNFEQPATNSQEEETSIETTTETESEKTAIVVEVDDTDEDTEDEDTEDTLVDTPLLLSDVVDGLGTVTDPSGKLSVIWQFDAGAYEGQVAVVSIESMQEAIHHALANVIDEVTEGAEFSGDIEELGSIVETPISEPTLEEYEFPKEDQPLIGFIDTHLTTGNPDINYSNISFSKDWIENDSNPTVVAGEGTHADHILGIVAATQDNSIGIDGINDVNDFEQELKPTEDSIESESGLFSQVISGYYTVEATGKVEFQLIADVSNYQGQLAVISMTGMENLDINSREFLQEALDRAIFGSEEKLGYIINDID